MSDDQLTTEQEYLLKRVRVEAQKLDRGELIDALCDSWEARFRLKQTFLSMSREAGFIFMLQERRPWRQPETEEDYKKALGYVPTEDEKKAYLKHQWESATMELDMDEIVLTPDEDE